MNRNPNQPDQPQDAGPIDEALLDEALTEPTPAELEAKILELTDPQMLSLLDEALAPEAASNDLTQRILAATTGKAPVEQRDESLAVLARIGPAIFRYAAAAAIALAVGLGVWFVNQGPEPTDSSIAGVVGTPDVSPDESADDASVGVSGDTSGGDPDWLTSEYATNTEFFESDLDEIADSLDDVTISRDTIWSELDAYEQFLTDIASDDV